MVRIGVTSLVAGLLLMACDARSGAQTDGLRDAFHSLSEAARRGDQAALDAWMDKPAVTASRQSQYDSLTGHGRWLKQPDATCAQWRPHSPRGLVDPQAPLPASELAVFLDGGPGEPGFYPLDNGKVAIALPYGVASASLELTRRDDGWRITGFQVPTEVPPPPQFTCERPRTG